MPEAALATVDELAPAAPRRRSYLLSRLLLVVLAIVAPLVALQLVSLQDNRTQARAAVLKALSARAADAAARIDGELGRAEQLLTFLASREEIRSLNAARCQDLVRGVSELGRVYANLLLIDAEGALVCSSIAPAVPFSFADVPWFRPGLQADGFRLGDPLVGKILGRKVAVLTLAVRQPSGERVGLVAAAIDLERLAESLQPKYMPPEYTVSVLKNGRFLLHSPDPGQWIGKPASADLRARRRAQPTGIVTGTGADGVERSYAGVDLPHYDLRVGVGMPLAMVNASADDEATQSAVVALLVSCLGVAAAFVASRRLAAPLHSIAATARALAAGHAGVRASPALPGEFGEVAVEFNRLMDRQEEGTAQLRSSQQRALRMRRYYEALSSTNQAIVRGAAPAALFHEVCGICVRSRLAEMAWIGLIEDGRLVPVAWGGGADRYTRDMTIALEPQPGERLGPTATALRSGRPVTVNDFVNDPSTRPWRERAVPFNVRASAAFPFTCDSAVVGALNLYVGEVDYFDAELVALLEIMVRDLSFALDAHRRDVERSAAEAALKAREVQLSGIVETVADAIVTVDERQTVVVFNNAAAELFGVSAREALGGPIARFVPQGLPTGCAVPHAPAARAGISLAGVRADGQACALKAMVSTQPEGAGHLTTAVLHDETQLRQASKARAALLAAESASRAKTAFLSNMSHELRTPLNAILGFTQLLQLNHGSALDDAGRQHLRHVFMAGTQLRALVDDVMDLSRIESGQMTVEKKPVELAGLVEGVLKMGEGLALKHGVALRADLARVPGAQLLTDPVRMRQILLNLVSNAIKYNRPGGRVVLSATLDAEAFRLQVADDGIGMSATQLGSLFQPFNRLGREATPVEGTGIGLNLTLQLAELLGGVLEIGSEENVGTRATLRLPPDVLLPADTRDGAVPAPEEADGSGADNPRGVVLYVEDNPVNALLVEQLLGRWPDVELVIADTGAQGIARAAQLMPDLVLLDMQLPDMSGLDVLARIRAEPATACLRVVALSASAMPEEVEAARRAGAEGYWTKPIDFAQVMQGVEEKLRRAPAAA